jgi:hypothetical protein
MAEWRSMISFTLQSLYSGERVPGRNWIGVCVRHRGSRSVRSLLLYRLTYQVKYFPVGYDALVMYDMRTATF